MRWTERDDVRREEKRVRGKIQPSRGASRAIFAVVSLMTAFVVTMGSMLAAGASSPADQGVTSKTITVGVPYVNFDALRSLGVNINEGSFPTRTTQLPPI